MTDYTAFGATNPGFTVYSASTSQCRAHEFLISSTAWVKALRFYRVDTTITGTIIGRVYQVTTSTTGTAVSGTDVSFTLSGTGWQTATMTSPVALTVNQRYRAAIYFPGNQTLLSNYWGAGQAGASGVTSGPLTIVSQASATGQLQGSFIAGSLAYPNAGSGVAGNYSVDVTVTDTDPNATSDPGQFFPFLRL
jgi:hypothetical protein